ncbi:hypothetical protein ES703_36632 [subsurface metagenome]
MIFYHCQRVVDLAVHKILVSQSLVHDYFSHSQSNDAVGSCFNGIPGIALGRGLGHPDVKCYKSCPLLDPGMDKPAGNSYELVVVSKRISAEVQDKAAASDILDKRWKSCH